MACSYPAIKSATDLKTLNSTLSKIARDVCYLMSSSTGGGVASVSGTTNRISVGGTTTDPTVDISSSYVGQTTITTLGTITTGVWSGTAIPYNKLTLTGSVVNADISASAAIANSKLANSAITINGTSTSLGGSIDLRNSTASLGSNIQTTSNVASDVTGLTLAVAANKKYKVVASLYIGCDNTGGVKFGLNGPSGSAIVSGIITGSQTTVNSGGPAKMGAIGALNSGNAFNRLNSTGGSATLIAYITTSSTAGNITLQFASANNGETSTVFSGSTIEIIETN